MSSPSLKQTVIALAIVQAFSSSAQAQTTEQPLAEVVVTGQWSAADRASVGSFSDSPLLKTPASITAIDRVKMQDLSIRNSTEATQFEASVSDSYNAVGYAEQFSIRGFKLNNNNGYRKDGFAISNDTQIPLENKERIEILKGLAGMQAGVAGPGGIINYVTKRPTAKSMASATLEARERGTVYGAVDLGGRFADKRFGYRINAAGERLRSYIKGADGERTFFSAALDWAVSDKALLQLDMDYQDKSQITAPGYQLIGNATLPKVSASTLLNNQPWTKPVDTISSNIGLRFEYQLSDNWRATLAANKHVFKRDDFTAFPGGCLSEALYPGYCSNGDYDVYDYQSVGERKTPFGTQALLQGTVNTGAIKHALTFGYADLERRDYYGDYVYELVGSSNIYNNRFVPPAASTFKPGESVEQLHDVERALFVQNVMTLSPQFTVHAGARQVRIERGADYSASFTLPNLSLVYSPGADWMVYGTIAHGMEYGGDAPFGSANYRTSLPPSRSKQLELGVKGVLNERVTLTAAVFELKRGKELLDATNNYVRAGEQTHRGLELGAQGTAMPGLAYSVSMMALDTNTSGSGSATFDGKRTINVPAFKMTAMADYAVSSVPGLTLSGALQYAGKKAFDDENQVFVPGYHVIDLGAAYKTSVGGYKTTLRAQVDNVADKFYWRDVTQELGGYLIPGAPRTARISAQFDF